ncbi:MAG: LON peptidase substrate-binding domain-containing protein [Acetobacteraceae bacterium]|nr:LON peptidase substrate-binding domain-containing protein [Acetobacteraceae bacterium]MDW8397476.1 LON peptidase substrate-binding domain-containing protein [Acetobacteraceae bacterium]
MTPAFHPRFEDLPAEIAIFPLPGALLLPEGRLPLNIFEPRYLAMTQDSLANGRMFGMIQPDPSAPATPHGPGLFRVGCLGRLSSFAETEDGRLLITLTGLIRFRVAEELPPRRGYRRVRADYAPFAADLETGRTHPGIDRAALLAALRPYFRGRGIEANWEAIEQTADPLLVTTLAMVCPFEVREKQALLEASTPADRAAMLIALMEMDRLGSASPADIRPS